MSALPILDVAPYLADPAGRRGREFVAELRRVVHEIGFFYLAGHGIDPAVAGDLHRLARRFFDLPEVDRLSVENVRSPQFRGYTRHGHERTNGQVDRRDQLDVGREQPARWPGPDEPAWLRLRGPNLWPAALPELRPAATAWMDALESLGQRLLAAMAEALGLAPDHFAAAVTPPEVLLKIIRYTGSADADAEAGAGQGVGAHRDTGFLTFVHQDGVGGLQVERDGRMIEVPPLDGTLVVNVGEMFQLVTNGYFKATVHRVVSPPRRRRADLAGVLLQPQVGGDAGAGGAPAGPRRRRPWRRQRRPVEPDPGQLRRQLAEGAPARPPRRGRRPPRRSAQLTPLSSSTTARRSPAL